jgi:CheY-like chemotaxis protein
VRVLVVEDERKLAAVLLAALHAEGDEVVVGCDRRPRSTTSSTCRWRGCVGRSISTRAHA